jgi:hypothetical protein
LTIALLMPADHYAEGDPCWLDLQVQNPGSERLVDLYVLLDVLGQYFAYPSWAEVGEHIAFNRQDIPTGADLTLNIVPEFTVPAVSPIGPLYFYAALFEPGTLSLQTLVSNGAVSEFSLGE